MLKQAAETERSSKFSAKNSAVRSMNGALGSLGLPSTNEWIPGLRKQFLAQHQPVDLIELQQFFSSPTNAERPTIARALQSEVVAPRHRSGM